MALSELFKIDTASDDWPKRLAQKLTLTQGGLRLGVLKEWFTVRRIEPQGAVGLLFEVRKVVLFFVPDPRLEDHWYHHLSRHIVNLHSLFQVSGLGCTLA